MKKVYQRIFDKDKGDCMIAAVATILGIDYEQVPHFIVQPDWHKAYRDFMMSYGYCWKCELRNPRALGFWGEEDIWDQIKLYNGINGLFLAAVYSPKFANINDKHIGSHQVICDKNLDIVFDPNPAYQNIEKYPGQDRMGCAVTVVDIFEKIEV